MFALNFILGIILVAVVAPMASSASVSKIIEMYASFTDCT